jgi:DnaJ-class molecular chaperone
MPQDLYDLLGVPRDADTDAIKHAYRARSRALHPDVSTDPDADARFSELSEAYSVLSRPESRRLYDRFGWRGKVPTKVVADVEVDPYEAHVGATRRVDLRADHPCEACEGSGRRKVVLRREFGRLLSFEDCTACSGTGVAKEARALDVAVPPGAKDRDRVPLGPDEVAIVKIVPPRDRAAVRAAALVALFVAVGFLLFLLTL